MAKTTSSEPEKSGSAGPSWYKPASKLRSVIKEALEAHPKNLDAAREHLFDELRFDADIAWAFMTEDYRVRRANELLHEAASTAFTENGSGQRIFEKQIDNSRPNSSANGSSGKDDDKPVTVSQHQRAKPNKSLINAENVKIANVKFCHPILRDWRFNGKPFGMCDTVEAKRALWSMGLAFSSAWERVSRLPDTGKVMDYLDKEDCDLIEANKKEFEKKYIIEGVLK